MTKEELNEATEALRNPREPLGHALALRIADLLEASTGAPEDVARDVATVRGVFAGMEGEYAETMGALSRLATAAARVPGLVEDASATREELKTARRGLLDVLEEHNAEPVGDDTDDLVEGAVEVTRKGRERQTDAESERDAARQEVDDWRGKALDRDLQVVAMTCRADALTARVAELERNNALQYAVLEDVQRRGDLVGPLERRAEKAEARATAAEAMARAVYAKLEDARSVIRHNATEVNATFPASVMDDDWATQPTPASAPAPGLREAVGPLAERLREVTNGPRSVYPSDLEFDWNIRLPSKTWLALLAAFDTTPASSPAPSAGLPATRAALTYLGSLSIGRPNAVEESRLYWAAMDELGAANPEPSVTHAALAAVVAQVQEDVAPHKLPLAEGVAQGAREVLRRVTGGHVPGVLLKSRVVEVLKRAWSGVLNTNPEDAFQQGRREFAEDCADALGLTLPTGPGTPPSGPGGGERVTDILTPLHRDESVALHEVMCHGCENCEPTPEDPALANASCGDTFEPANGEPVSSCDLPRGHDGAHKGWCLGSRATWAQTQPEPAAPEVVWESPKGLRVMPYGQGHVVEAQLTDGSWAELDDTTPKAAVLCAEELARALAEAQRENATMRECMLAAANERARNAAEAMRERAALALLARRDAIRAGVIGGAGRRRGLEEAAAIVRALPIP